MLGSTLTTERRVVEVEQQIARQRSAFDQLVRAGRGEREVELARSVLASLQSKLRFAQDQLRFERHRYSL